MFTSILRITILGCLLVLITASGNAQDKKPDDKKVELNVGDVAPAFEARSDADATWESSGRFGKKWVVIYFYPGDFTPGCTAQAKAFTAAMDKLTEKGVEVVGISGDSVRTHELFKKAHKLNFTLLADEEGAIANKFGVPFGKGATVKAREANGKPLEIESKQYEFERKGTAARWTYVIGKDGKIAYKNIKVTPALDAKAITDFISKADEQK